MGKELKQKYIKSYDGTKIGYQVIGKGKIPFVLCNGLGGTALTWSPLYNELLDQFKFITWDYRGLFTSERPEDEDAITIPHHARDLEVILKKENVKSAVFGGWSMGVQVCLEYYSRNPKQYKAMFLINGTYGSPLDTALNSRLSKYVVPYVNTYLKKAMPKIQPKLQPLAEKVINRDEFIKIVSKIGLVHENLDNALFKEVAQGMMKTDLTMFHHILDHLAEHDASEILPDIHVPTLIIASTRDLMTPPQVAETMAEIIPHAELLILNKASHYSLLEFPDIINRRLKQFLSEHVL